MPKKNPVYTRRKGKTPGAKAVQEHMKRIALPKKRKK